MRLLAGLQGFLRKMITTAHTIYLYCQADKNKNKTKTTTTLKLPINAYSGRAILTQSTRERGGGKLL